MARTINQNLARACRDFGMGMGLGSCRGLLFSDEYLADFNVRHLIGDDFPLYANLGIAQLEQLIDTNQLKLIDVLLDKLKANGLIIHVNPIERAAPPKTALEISNRLNEITFNSALMKELRAIGFVQKLMDEGWIKDEYKEKMKYVLMHSLRAENALSDLSAESKMESDWEFLTMLRDRGRTYATEWLNENYDDIGHRSTVDVKKEFL